ncbi:hypothetical protein B0T25DRAFT_608708, partial [Lasiosphaeria hispida]
FQGLQLPPPDAFLGLKPNFGGQNFAHCCLLAVNASFQVNHQDNGTLEYSSQPFIDPIVTTPSDFADYAAKGAGLFPCGAQFDGNMSGAPAVRVPYSWCQDSCNGWQLSDRTHLTQWIGPMVGFILPCVAFCMSIPRKHKLSIPPWVFSPSPWNRWSIVLYTFGSLYAIAIAAIDTVGWLCICFALAGPMLLSAVYESWIDMRLLRYLWKEIIHDSHLSDFDRANKINNNTIPTGFNVRGDLSFLPTAANCTVIWNPYIERPFGRVTPCPDPGIWAGRWTVEMQPQNRTGYGPSATRDFKLRFVLEESIIVNTGILSKTFVGVGSFALQDTLNLVCGASGVCTSELKGDKVLINQELTNSTLHEWN